MATKKRILKDFILTEISGVDRPAQPTATIAIMKKAPGTPDPIADLVRSAIERHMTDHLTKAKTEADTMTEAEKQKAAIDALTKKVDELTAANEANAQLAKMSDAEKEFMTNMDDDAKKAFASMTEEERKAKMKMAKNATETLTVNGVTVNKAAVGSDVFGILQAQQDQLAQQATDVAKAQEAVANAAFAKRAADEFGAVPGTAEEVAAVLKTFNVMPEAVRNTAEAVFKAAQEMAVKAGVQVGHPGKTGKTGDESPLEKLETLAKNYAEANKVNYNTAYAAVIEANAELYEAALNEGN